MAPWKRWHLTREEVDEENEHSHEGRRPLCPKASTGAHKPLVCWERNIQHGMTGTWGGLRRRGRGQPTGATKVL